MTIKKAALEWQTHPLLAETQRNARARLAHLEITGRTWLLYA